MSSQFSGKLSHWLQMAVGNSAENVDYVLIDRANNRYKVLWVFVMEMAFQLSLIHTYPIAPSLLTT